MCVCVCVFMMAVRGVPLQSVDILGYQSGTSCASLDLSANCGGVFAMCGKSNKTGKDLIVWIANLAMIWGQKVWLKGSHVWHKIPDSLCSPREYCA